jgi:hypothetical protein
MLRESLNYAENVNPPAECDMMKIIDRRVSSRLVAKLKHQI